jgi:hypothetical protein
MQRYLSKFGKYLVIIIGLVHFSSSANVNAQDKHYYFYHPENDYGSELVSNPLTLLLNGSYDVLRNGGHENNDETINIFKLDYKQGMTNVWDNITSPAYHINHYGWDRFLEQEVFPTSLNQDKAQWVPNYGHHILGSGMLYARMGEWLDYRAYKHPYLLSFLITTTYQFMNETLENNHSDETNVDPIADLLIFNPLGFLVFSSTSVKRFFSETVRMYDWSLQPVFNPFNQYIENAGLQFVFKYKLSSKYDLMFYYGIYGILGLSYSYNKEHNFSFGAGTVVNRLEENIIHDSRIITPTTDGAIGLFYDRNNSLMTSILLTGPRQYNARINIYPGFIKWGNLQPGFYAGFGEWDNFLIGITFAHFPVGLLTGFN